MMILNEQEHPHYNYFRQVIQEHRLSHGYAFTGPDEGMKRAITQYVVQSLACQSTDGAPCLECQMCQRIEHNQFADVIYIRPDGQTIKVDQVRQLKEWLSTSPVESTFKFAVIEQAESMNAAAANALLTFLEEPIENVYLILYSSDIQKLLPTIQSRVQQVYFNLSAQQDKESLIHHGIDPAHAGILTSFPMEMMRTLVEEYEFDAFKEWLNCMHYFYRLVVCKEPMAFVAIQTHLKPFLSVQGVLNSLEYLSMVNHSVLMTMIHKEETSRIQTYFVEELCKKVSLDRLQLLKLNEALLECKRQVMANVSPQLALEALVLQLTK